MRGTIESGSWAGCYERLVRRLMRDPDHVVSPRSERTFELVNQTLKVARVLPDDHGLVQIRGGQGGTDLTYLAAELYWYLSARRDAGFIAQHASLWDKVKNPDGTVNSAYGYKLFRERNDHGLSQWEWAWQQLNEDRDTRRAVMVFHDRSHHWMQNRDVPCTMFAQFLIRDQRLHLSVHMRSSDAWFGLRNDVPFFLLLLRGMAQQVGVSVGSFALHLGSSHAYADRDESKLGKVNAYGCTVLEAPFSLNHEDLESIGSPNTFQHRIMSVNSPFVSWIKEAVFNQDQHQIHPEVEP